MRFFSRILEKIIYTSIVFAAVLLFWSALSTKSGPKLLVVLSGSMEPSIHTGSVVVGIPKSQYKVGDVVTFGGDIRGGVPTTHRIVLSRTKEGVLLFTTKGDANNTNDGKEIEQGDIQGKVLFSIPLLGYIIDFVRKPLGMIIVIVLPAVYIITDEIRKIINQIKKMSKENEK